jgi:hypothetical protein
MLDAQRGATIAFAITAAGYDSRQAALLAAAGRSTAELCDEHGVIDPASVISALTESAETLGVTLRRRVAPTRQQGRPSADVPGTSWSELLGKATKG